MYGGHRRARAVRWLSAGQRRDGCPLGQITRQMQSKFEVSARTSGDLGGILRSFDRAESGRQKMGGPSYEDRRHRRHRPHRDEAREQAAREGPRGRGCVARLRRQHHHRRGTGRGAGGRSGRRRPGELALLRGQGGPRVLRDGRPQSPCRGGDRRRGAPSRALGRRHRPPSRKRLFAREDGPGEPDQGVRNSVYDRSLHPILRVHRPHRRIRRRRQRHSAVACPSAADRIG